MDLKIVLVILAFLVVSDCQEEIEEESPELHPLDGYFNNLLHPDWGAVDTVLLRKSPPAYGDGVYTMAGQNRPNPFDISERAHRSNIAASLGSVRGRTAMQVYFGQQVVEEIMDSQRPGCPREYENIPVPKNNTLYRDSEAFNSATDTVFMPFPRSRFDQRTGQSPSNPRQQLNEITPYLDGQLMYGPARTGLMPSGNFGEGNFLFLIPLKVYGTVFQPSMMSVCPLPTLPIPVRIPEREDSFQWPDFGDLETPELWRTPFSCPLEYCGSGGIITGQRNTLR